MNLKPSAEMQEYMDTLHWCKSKGLSFTKDNAKEMVGLYRNRNTIDCTTNSRGNQLKGFDLSNI